MGRNMTITSIHIKGTLAWAAAQGAASPLSDRVQVRLVLAVDHQTNGVSMTGPGLFDPDTTNNINSFRNLENSGRFTILHDKLYHVGRYQIGEGAADFFASSAGQKQFAINRKFKKGLKVRFSIGTTTGVIGNIQDNSMHMLGLVNVSNFAVLLSYTCRIRYLSGTN